MMAQTKNAPLFAERLLVIVAFSISWEAEIPDLAPLL
jgi:hypothetical protein